MVAHRAVGLRVSVSAVQLCYEVEAARGVLGERSQPGGGSGLGAPGEPGTMGPDRPARGI